jgi:hypothetical protein
MLDPSLERVAIDVIAIAEDVASGRRPRQSFHHLLRSPGTGRIRGHVHMEYSAPGQTQDHERGQQPFTVGTTAKSMAIISPRWLRRNVRHPGEGGR